jgi:nitrogen regulatory protein P-II 1
MKKIECVVPHLCVDEVMDALAAAGIEAVVARNVKSFGSRKGHTEWYRGTEYSIAFVPEVKVEVLVPDEQCILASETIKATVNRGAQGNGSILIFDCEEFAFVPTADRAEAIS